MKDPKSPCGIEMGHEPDNIHWHYFCPGCGKEFDLDGKTEWEDKPRIGGDMSKRTVIRHKIYKIVQTAICDWMVNEVQVITRERKKNAKVLVNMITKAIMESEYAPKTD